MFARLSTTLLYVLLVLTATAVATPNPTAPFIKATAEARDT
ncbi:hypothetical protein AZE42_02476 [Rhizopogon vesiculosus]|uniref:Uncharacterized protein n=1 Tax=Rhizopogon vesiculosus TaxID=180088 RepID=A0A1J8QEG6_9AGAM|nr:hypothetical protein AZE42_02476 [Rhizopogon vesiculosus]